jgi:hypothetical protein
LPAVVLAMPYSCTRPAIDGSLRPGGSSPAGLSPPCGSPPRVAPTSGASGPCGTGSCCPRGPQKTWPLTSGGRQAPAGWNLQPRFARCNNAGPVCDESPPRHPGPVHVHLRPVSAHSLLARTPARGGGAPDGAAGHAPVTGHRPHAAGEHHHKAGHRDRDDVDHLLPVRKYPPLSPVRIWVSSL